MAGDIALFLVVAVIFVMIVMWMFGPSSPF
jgi:hypothetical protein